MISSSDKKIGLSSTKSAKISNLVFITVSSPLSVNTTVLLKGTVLTNETIPPKLDALKDVLSESLPN